MDKLDIVLTELKKANERLTAVEAAMATKSDITSIEAKMTTKDDITSIEAKMATKDDITSIEAKMATKKDVEEIPYIAQAVLEINNDVKRLVENQASIFELLGEHEVAIRSLRRRPV